MRQPDHPMMLVELRDGGIFLQPAEALAVRDIPEPGPNPDGSKNKFEKALKGLPRTGHIGFQDHGHSVCYRKIRITKL